MKSPGSLEVSDLCLPGPGEQPEQPSLPKMGHWLVESVNSSALPILMHPGSPWLNLPPTPLKSPQLLVCSWLQLGHSQGLVSSHPLWSDRRYGVWSVQPSGAWLPSDGRLSVLGGHTPSVLIPWALYAGILMTTHPGIIAIILSSLRTWCHLLLCTGILLSVAGYSPTPKPPCCAVLIRSSQHTTIIYQCQLYMSITEGVEIMDTTTITWISRDFAAVAAAA